MKTKFTLIVVLLALACGLPFSARAGGVHRDGAFVVPRPQVERLAVWKRRAADAVH
jgi:hypothetical protein